MPDRGGGMRVATVHAAPGPRITDAPCFWLEISGITAPTFSRSALNVKLADFDEFEVGALRAT